jgi:hypothetical protein
MTDTILYIDTVNTFDSGSEFLLPINPIQPRDLVKNQPAKPYNTIEGVGGVQGASNWFPLFTMTWPDIVLSNSNHAALLAAFEERQYVKVGLEYFIGILPAATKGDGFLFPTSNKYIKIRIIEVKSSENPIPNDINEQIQDMVVTAVWVDVN